MADIELVIKIPDHLYELLKDLPSDSNEGTIENVLIKAVENGIPLEKIRAEQKALITTNSTADYSNGVMNCLNVIDKYKGDKG